MVGNVRLELMKEIEVVCINLKVICIEVIIEPMGDDQGEYIVKRGPRIKPWEIPLT